jgi:hypothetical protein
MPDIRATADSRPARRQNGGPSASDSPCGLAVAGLAGPVRDRTQVNRFKPLSLHHGTDGQWRTLEIFKRNKRAVHNYEGVLGLLQMGDLQRHLL